MISDSNVQVFYLRQTYGMIEGRILSNRQYVRGKDTPMVTQSKQGFREVSPHTEEFGEFVRRLRHRWKVSLDDVVFYLPNYLPKWGKWQRVTFNRIENGRRSPRFAELYPLYQALQRAGVDFTIEETQAFVDLARHRIETKQKRRERYSDAKWNLLRGQLIQDNYSPQVHTTRDHAKTQAFAPDPPDTSHILGRDAWLQSMLDHLHSYPAKKLIVVQGPPGIGKSSALTLLLQNLADDAQMLPLYFHGTFSNMGVLAEESLDRLLATIIATLAVYTEDTQTLPLPQRIDFAIHQLATASKHVALLLDHAEVLLQEGGLLAPCWQEFLTLFLHRQHHGTLFIATREWPGWTGKDRSFVVESVLPALSPESAAVIWRRLGFSHASEHLLQEASRRCGGNPQMIELRAATLRHRCYAFSWESGEIMALPEENDEDLLLQELLAEPHIFGDADVEAQQLLQQVITSHLSQDAEHLLGVLALTEVALGFHLLSRICQNPTYAWKELQRASLIDENAMVYTKRARLLPLVREAVIQKLSAEGRTADVERQVIALYEEWLSHESLNEQEKSAVVTALLVLFLKHQRLLDAAQLLAEWGWLSLALGQGTRLARLAYGITATSQWRQVSREAECGGLLLRAHLARYLAGKGIGKREREVAYERIYDLWSTGQVTLRPATIMHVLHHHLRALVYQDRFVEAHGLLQTVRATQGAFHDEPLVEAALLANEGYVLGRWSESRQAPPEEALHLRRSSVQAYAQSIALLRACERQALPLQKSAVYFRLARYLNDMAYYLRLLGQFEEAKRAMEECVELKEAGYTLSASRAISRGEYAQVLADLGQFRAALTQNELALAEMRHLSAAEHHAVHQDIAMLQVERGRLLVLLGQLEAAQSLFEQAWPHLVESRRPFLNVAEEQLALIQRQYRENPQRKLDWRWFDRYHAILSYDSTAWLTAAGPFTSDEQQVWEVVAQRQDEGAKSQKAQLITASRKRELAEAIEQGREPQLCYPLIPIGEVEERYNALLQLRDEIAAQEPNALVRRFYIEAIVEHLADLSQVKAVYIGDNAAYWTANAEQYSIPRQEDMAIALFELKKLLQLGMQRQETVELSTRITEQLRQWRAFPLFSSTEEQWENEDSSSMQQGESDTPMIAFPPGTVKRFYAEVFQEYGFLDWSIIADPTMSHARVELDMKQLFVPAQRSMTWPKLVLEFAHEIEAHVVRAESGRKSPLSLLSSGLRGYLPTDEGLAIYYEQEAARAQQLLVSPKLWLGTLATGFACGIISPPLTFRHLYHFFEQVLLLQQLLLGKSFSSAQAEARQTAFSRCLRTYRGVPHLEEAGICSTKDAHYLEGYRSVKQAIAEGITFEQLMVGSCALNHLAELAELGIVKPAIQHRRLAVDPGLLQRLMQLDS
jgi:hypothetical protein